jgi:hypothetical protein
MKATLQTKPKTSSRAPPILTPVWSGLLQGKCACGGTPGPTGESEACRNEQFQRHSEDADLSAIGRPSPSASEEVPPVVQEVLRLPGQSLDTKTLKFMEPRFGHDLSNVRIHTHGQAAASAREVNALAYTVGRDVVFGAGQYQPETGSGRSLLAHELTHVIQQGSLLHAAGILQRKPAPGVSTKIVDHGASAGAVALAKKRMKEVLGSLKNPGATELKGKTVELHIIPHNKNLTDLPEFGSLKGAKTFDGRSYNELRGVGATKVGDAIRYAIAEEQLVEVEGKPAGYELGFVAAHESGHVVEQFGLTKSQKRALSEAYDARKAAKGPWLNPESYTSSGTGEYFAQATAAYFGRPYSSSEADKKTYTRAWLAKNDAPMAKLLSSIYS